MDFLCASESLQPHVSVLGRLASLGQFAEASSQRQRSRLALASPISVVAHWTARDRTTQVLAGWCSIGPKPRPIHALSRTPKQSAMSSYGAISMVGKNSAGFELQFAGLAPDI